MKIKTEYVKVDMTNSEIAKAMIDGEAFYSDDGDYKLAWSGSNFFFKSIESSTLYLMNDFGERNFYRKTEVQTTKWDDVNDYVRNISNSNYAIKEDDDIIVDARMTKEQWLDFAHILLESE